jgi:hypothetical protein
MTDKKVFDLEIRKELKDTKQIMDKAVEDLTYTVISKEELVKENQELKTKIIHLETLLINSQVPDLTPRTPEEEIIKVEIKRMYDAHVTKNIPLVDKDDIKKLKTLVDALAVIRGSQPQKTKKEKEMSIEDALSLVSDMEKQ